MLKIKSINTTLALFIFIFFTCFITASVIWISKNTYDVTLEEQEKNMIHTANFLVTSVKNFINEAKGITKIISKDHSTIDVLTKKDTSAGKAILEDILSSIPYYYAATLFDNSGRIIAGLKPQTPDGGSVQSLSFFENALSPAKEAIQVHNTVFRSKDGSRLLFAVTGQIKDNQGALLGGVVLYPDWSQFTDDLIDPIRVGDNGYGLMMDSKAIVIAHALNKKILLDDNSRFDFNQKVIATKHGKLNYSWDGKDKVMVYHDIPETGWIVSMSAYKDDLAAAAITQRNVLISGGIGAIVLAVSICMLLLRSLVVHPMKTILEYTTAIADGDLKAELKGKFKYEFVELTAKIKIMVAELKNKLGFAEGVLEGMSMPCAIVDKNLNLIWLNHQLSELVRSSQKPEEFFGMPAAKFYFGDAPGEAVDKQAIAEKRLVDVEFTHTFPNNNECTLRVTAVPFYDMDGNLLGSVTNVIDLTEIHNQQQKIVEQNEKISKAAADAESISQHLATAAEELSAQVEQASKGAFTQQERMEETATAMSQMNTSVLEVARNASQAAQVTEDARKEAEHGASNLGLLIQTIGQVQTQSLSLKQSMSNLGEQAQDIGNVMNVITDIADQTNLLALNAAIEAARAGEAGRGFAVVADEVRKLAEKTMDATKEVGSAIANIQSVADQNIKATDNTVNTVTESTKLAEESGQVLKAIVSFMENASSQVSGIATAAEEQSSTSEQINHSTEEVNQLTRESTQLMGESTKAVQEVARMASELTQVIDSMH